MDRFLDRRQAGVLLGRALHRYVGQSEVIVLGLPRGGIPVAYEVALALDAPLDVLVVRKLGVPGHEEVAMGALASGGIQVMDPRLAGRAGAGRRGRACIEAECAELERIEQALRGDREPLELRGRTVILVDDGLATGSSMHAAIAAVSMRGAAEIVVAVPVGAREACRAVAAHVDEVICLEQPEPFYTVGVWYEDSSQTSDAEVRALLAAPRAASGPVRRAGSRVAARAK